MKQKCVVELHYGVYGGEEIVYCDENDDRDTIIAIAWRQMKKQSLMTLSMAYTNAKIISREVIG